MTDTTAPADFLLVGRIVAPFGVRGQVKMRSLTDYPEYLGLRIRNVYVGPTFQKYPIAAAFEHKPGLLVLTLAGVGTREASEALRGVEVFILEREAVPLKPGEYFIHQLYGLKVATEVGEELGTVREVLETGSNEVLVVARSGKPDALIPVIQDAIQELDIPNQRVIVRLMPGLLD